MASAAAAAADVLPEVVAFLKARLGARAPEVAIVCGSGLSNLSDSIASPLVIPYASIPHWPHATVAGHGTELVVGELGGKTVIAQRGRFHRYEGWSLADVVIAVRVFAALGCRCMIATNAAGGVNADFSVGDIMVIEDHISFPCLAGNHPLVGPNDARFGDRFPAVNAAYDARLRAAAEAAAAKRGLAGVMRRGTYVHDSGPSYESPSEIRFMRRVGGDAVGMSTVPEVIVAAHSGMAVLGLSLITNQCLAPGDARVPPSHQEVLETSARRSADMQGLVADIVAAIDVAALPTPRAAAAFAAPDGGRAGAPPPPPGAGAAAAAGVSAAPAARAVRAPWSPLEWSAVLVAAAVPAFFVAKALRG